MREAMSGRVEEEILRLLGERGPGKTICPTEVARSIAGTEERVRWEPLMADVRAAAQRLVADGRVVITQRGVPVDGLTAKGPIRFDCVEVCA